MINFVFLSQLSHFYALTLKHSTLIYSHSCYSHRFWLPVHTLFSITSLSFLSHFIVSLVRIWRERAKTCLYVHLNTDRCYVCSNYAFVGVFLVQLGAVKLVLWRHGMHVTQVHPVTAEDQFHCTMLYISILVSTSFCCRKLQSFLPSEILWLLGLQCG